MISNVHPRKAQLFVYPFSDRMILIGEDSEPAIPNQISSVNSSFVTGTDSYKFSQLFELVKKCSK